MSVKVLYGFPCELEDPEILDVARRNRLDDKEAEERRLFYVAVSRAKEHLYIYTQQGEESKFLSDMKKYVTHDNLYWEKPE